MNKKELLAYGLTMAILLFVINAIGYFVFKIGEFEFWRELFQGVLFGFFMAAFRYYEVKNGWFKKK